MVYSISQEASLYRPNMLNPSNDNYFYTQYHLSYYFAGYKSYYFIVAIKFKVPFLFLDLMQEGTNPMTNDMRNLLEFS